MRLAGVVVKLRPRRVRPRQGGHEVRHGVVGEGCAVVFREVRLAAAYVATLFRIFARAPRFAEELAPAGRMALTNYLGQSLLAVLVFTGVGLGLVGRVGPATVLLVAVAIFAVQLWFSRWWLARHRYGPVEWVLRAVTNAERPDNVPR